MTHGPGKIDLGVGVYKTAEKQLWERETTKSYVGVGG
jgi:aspartate/tyrosine/aromatic aminotransferase